MICPQCDMPTTADGIVPDIIMNHHGAVPSRMTTTQLIECILGNSAKLGCMGDGTPFENTDASKRLEECWKVVVMGVCGSGVVFRNDWR